MTGDHLLMLYDMEYVKGGCVGEPPPGTAKIDTFGTYSSNYAIAIVGLAAAVAMLLNKRASTSYKTLSINFFAWTAFGYGVAGVLHQVLHEDEEHAEHAAWWKASYVATLLGILALNILANQLLYVKVSANSVFQLIITAIAVLFGGGIILSNIFGSASLMLTGVYSAVVLLYVVVVFAVWCEWPKVLGLALMIIGMIVQVALTPMCGDAAYPDCFKDCPLPAPYFNHNALFHWLFAIGLLILGIALNTNPELASSAEVTTNGFEQIKSLVQVESKEERMALAPF
eukprot:CAMPEP_0203938638 /NCGR_PEP_ID=MMETSP0359-20131031/75616_1 /ASSEMBLY_ACC=CAM_ASM_000338 /TAXON_ID=268821 /ORGANISM="Scrippsiella Hangoei, Strain SHTV-5" /LENGTH=284 /DNA_ID=CAMNT_0050868863 /DNA_START=20 /DNA_END=876 /DNA_ORIENTATION=+